MTRFDVVILGGGSAGCATALALARHGIARVLVVEAGRYDAVRIGECIPPDTRIILHDLGVWEDFQKEDHEPCLGSCSSWGSDALGYNDICSAMAGTWIEGVSTRFLHERPPGRELRCAPARDLPAVNAAQAASACG